MPFGAYAVPQTTIGLGKEVTRGTAVAPAYWIKPKAPKYVPNLAMIEDDTLQGSMVSIYNQTPGMRHDTHAWDTYPYLDHLPLLIEAELGSPDTLTTAPTSTTLSASAVAGATTISVTVAIAANTWFTVGSGNTIETHYAKSVVTTTVTLLYPLLYNQSNGATVAGLTGHTFSLLNNAGSGNQSPTITITDYDGEEWRQLTAGTLDKLSFKGSDTGYADYTCSWFANASQTPSAPSPSFTSTPATPGWTARFTLGGVISQDVEDWTFDLARGTKVVPALSGTQAYLLYFQGPLQATAKVTVVEQSGAPELTQYLNGTQAPFDMMLMDRATGFGMRVHCSNAMYKTGSLMRSKEWVEAELDIQFLPTSTDATAGGVSPCQIQVGNSTITAY